jgi:hypothetical protein
MHAILHRAMSPQTVTHVWLVVSLLFTFALAFASSAHAAGPSPYANGLHISTGALADPLGRTWVADHNAGFCRVTVPVDGPAAIEHPQTPDEGGSRTCLGGLLPEAGVGPDAAGQPAFVDPSPEFANSGDEFALIPDGASPSADVVRADWNPDTGLFEFRDTITMNADPNERERPRPVAVSLAPDGNAYVSFQRSGTIQRIADPDSAEPTVELVAATSDGRGAAALAATYGTAGPHGPPTIVVAETTGLRELVGTPTDPAAPRLTVDSDYDLPAGVLPTVSALAYEVTNPAAGTGRLYAGTADAVEPFVHPGPDRVLRWDGPGAAAVHAAGFSTVGGLGFDRTGGLLVLDDPAIVMPGEPLGAGRMFRVADTWARIRTGPDGATNDATPAFTFEGEGALECRVTGSEWQDCDGSFTAAEPTDGAYAFSVRPKGSELADVRRFRVDTAAPTAAPSGLEPGERDVYLPASVLRVRAGRRRGRGHLRVPRLARHRVPAVRRGPSGRAARRGRAHARRPRPRRRRQPGRVRRRLAGVRAGDVHGRRAARGRPRRRAVDRAARRAAVGGAAGRRPAHLDRRLRRPGRQRLGGRPQRRPVPRERPVARLRRAHRAP